MHFLYGDESNLEERAGDFLIYGGIVIDSARALELSREIDAIRSRARVDRSFRLKFGPRPENLSHEEFKAVKQAVIETSVRLGAQLLLYVVLHDIANDPDEARRNGINTVCYHFDSVLNRLGGAGLVLIDRFNDAGNKIDAHLSEKFAVGVTGLPFSKEYRLSNIVGLHHSAIGQSHFPSIVDIVLGSVRFAVNAHTRGKAEHLNSARRVLNLVSPLFHRDKAGGSVSEIGLLFSPKTVEVAKYRQRYESLKAFLAEAGIETAQQISAERR